MVANGPTNNPIGWDFPFPARQLSPGIIASRLLKVFTWSPFARGHGRSRLPSGGGVLVLRPRLPRGNPVLPHLGIHLRLVEPLEAGVGRRLRGVHCPRGLRQRRHSTLSEVRTFAGRPYISPFYPGGGGTKGHSAKLFFLLEAAWIRRI